MSRPGDKSEQTKPFRTAEQTARMLLRHPDFSLTTFMKNEDFEKVEPLVKPHFEHLQGLMLYLERQYNQAKDDGERSRWMTVLRQFIKRLKLDIDPVQAVNRFGHEMLNWRQLLGYYQRTNFEPNDILDPSGLVTSLSMIIYSVFAERTANVDFPTVNQTIDSEVKKLLEKEKQAKQTKQESPEQIRANFEAMIQELQSKYWQDVQL